MTKRVLVVATSHVEAGKIESPIDERYGRRAEIKVVAPFADEPVPLEAIDEAVHDFGADELVVVTNVSEEASWLESGTVESARDRFDVPVTYLLVA
jgi:hypothetical protein